MSKATDMSFIYISEPGVIDPQSVVSLLHDDSYRVMSGDVDFTGSDQHPFDTLLMRSQTTIRDNIKNVFPNLKNIVRVGTGLDNVDLEFCKANQIAIYNAAGANADAVSEYVVATALFALRKLYMLSDQDISKWNRFKFRGHSISEQTIGIIGFGNIGKLVYEKLHAFKPKKFLVYDPYITQDMVKDFNVTITDLNTLLKQCSLATLHLPLTPETRYLIGGDNIRLLPDHAILINASRGGIVDEQSLIDYASSHDILYIADTVENEPHPSRELLASSQAIITPHIASLTKASEDAMLFASIENLSKRRPVRL